MLAFKRLWGPHGIPMFYEQLPLEIKGTGIALIVFTGSADDTNVGKPGIYHWFEHVPFRGTRKYPGGYAATKGRITRIGGRVGAWTNTCHTGYWSTVPTRCIEQGIDIVTELASQPLLRGADIVVERDIIHQEIRRTLGSASGTLRYLLPSILWEGHPFGAHTLGTMDSLDEMSPALLLDAQALGYDRSRMVLIISTALSEEEVLKYLFSSNLLDLPMRGLSERRRGADYGPLPAWKEGKRTVIKTEFPATVVKVLFPPVTLSTWEERARHELCLSLFSCGGLGSPLYRKVREETPLAYAACVHRQSLSDTECWGFNVETSRADALDVEQALSELLKDPQLMSRAWFNDVMEYTRGAIETEVMDPTKLVHCAATQISSTGGVVSNEVLFDLMLTITHEEVVEMIKNLSFEQAHTIIALGQ